jgi:nitroreductase
MKNPSPIKSIQRLIQILKAKPEVPASLANQPLLQVIYHRRSVRSFSSTPIPEDAFAAILEAGRLAPSTVNLQSWTFATFDESQWRETFSRSIPFKGQRAIIIISDTHRYRQVFPDFPDSPLTEYTIAVVNASLAAMNMNIAAEALGIASVMLSETCRTGILDTKYLKEHLSLPGGCIPLMTLVLGYPRGSYPPMPPKLPKDQIVIQGQYREADTIVLQNWLEQMIAGYNASHLGMTFQDQVKTYADKIHQAESDLNDLVFNRE